MAKNEEIFIIKTQKDLTRTLAAVAHIQPAADNPYILRFAPEAEKRRSKQNRLSFKWYDERGKATGHGKEHERCLCKLHYGVPIMRQHEDFNDLWENTLDHLLYEQQFMAMEHFDVTSLMSVREFAQYLTAIDNESADMGIALTHPDDLYWDALLKESY